jgi:hypothetical protein
VYPEWSYKKPKWRPDNRIPIGNNGAMKQNCHSTNLSSSLLQLDFARCAAMMIVKQLGILRNIFNNGATKQKCLSTNLSSSLLQLGFAWGAALIIAKQLGILRNNDHNWAMKQNCTSANLPSFLFQLGSARGCNADCEKCRDTTDCIYF